MILSATALIVIGTAVYIGLSFAGVDVSLVQERTEQAPPSVRPRLEPLYGSPSEESRMRERIRELEDAVDYLQDCVHDSAFSMC